MNPEKPLVITTPVLVLTGPTAIGKTELALEMARRFGCEIISVDAMQVYRHMNIGTAKPSSRERAEITHHLIDIVDPDEQYDAAKFVSDSLEAIQRIIAAGRIPLLTGGTGLYLKALTRGLFSCSASPEQKEIRQELLVKLERQGREELHRQLSEVDPDSAARIHPNDSRRLVRALEIYQATGRPWSKYLQERQIPPASFAALLQIGLTCERRLLHDRIEQRTILMLDTGLAEEVEKLREMGYSASLTSMRSIGYRHINNYLDGLWSRDEAIRLLIRDTRRYAKRQMTWFNAIPAMRWYDRRDRNNVLRDTEQWLNSMVGRDLGKE